MNHYQKQELKQLFSEFLWKKQDSYIIHELFQQFPTSTALMDASEQQIITIKGIGMGKARQITALLKLAKALAIPTETDNLPIRTPKDVFQLLEPEFRHLTKEHFICLFLNTKNCLIFKEIISICSLNATVVHPREVFRAALKHCSASLICIHNHPSSDPTPLTEDVNLTTASYLLKHGMSLKDIQVWLGHADIGTTANIYAHIDLEMKTNTAKTINDIFTKRKAAVEAVLIDK